MTSFALFLEPIAGSSVERCCAEAAAMADRLGVAVCFDFNGIFCAAWPGAGGDALAARLTAELRRERGDDCMATLH
jgi:hypothetical protein